MQMRRQIIFKLTVKCLLSISTIYCFHHFNPIQHSISPDTKHHLPSLGKEDERSNPFEGDIKQGFRKDKNASGVKDPWLTDRALAVPDISKRRSGRREHHRSSRPTFRTKEEYPSRGSCKRNGQSFD
ncbi:hypothetical protein BT69DRAFT_581389 [Atractiella rhizophila]|nr:hypothetical protein BT69DRAFT_581389 [Atractiella rhizophila]